MVSRDALCPFCVIASGTDHPSVESKQSDVFYRDRDVVAFISAGWWPNNPGSVLIIPTGHYRTIYEIPPAAYAAVNEVGRSVGIAMKREYGCAGISFRQHNEAAGGQSVDHFHLWVFPRHLKDRLYELYAHGAVVPIDLRSQYAQRLERSLLGSAPARDARRGVTRPGPGARLVIICGLPGSGKTTLARQLEGSLRAVRFAPDEWMDELSINLHDADARARVEALQWKFGQELLKAGLVVIVEWGTWGRAERDALRLSARAVGAAVELRYVSAPPEVLFDRIQRRGREDPPITRDAFLQWSEIFQAPNTEELMLFDPPLEGDR